MDLPKITGKYSVGTSVHTTKDEECGKYITYRIYYPVRPEDTDGCKKDELMSRAVMKAMGKEFFVKQNYDKKTASGENVSDFYLDAPHVPGEKFPLVLFNHGFKSYKEGNSFLCAELASQGYVVISIGHEGVALAETRTDGTEIYYDKSLTKKTMHPMIPYAIAAYKCMKMKGTPEECYAKFDELRKKYCNGMLDVIYDCSKSTLFVLDEARREYGSFIDLDKGVAATGHSFGGAIAYYLCQTSPEITCGLNIDGGLFGEYEGMTMTKPFFQICSEDNYSVETKPMLDKTEPAYYATFLKIKHIGFADCKFYVPAAAMTGKIPGDVMHENLCMCHLKFLDKYLKGKDGEIDIKDSEYLKFEVF